ncbi:MAG: right-handed parallel beta-helix repeat-containing protein [Balneolales bacterium]
MNRKEAIKRSALLMGGCALVPGAMGLLNGCTPGSPGDISGIGDGSGNDIIDDGSALFSSVAALRATRGEIGETAILAGYFVAEDGGGSEIFWDDESTEDDDNGLIFKVDDVSKGRWKRKEEDYVNVKWFGVKGDGNYSSETVDIFNQCFGLVAAGLTKRIYVPSGVYVIKQAFAQLDAELHNGLELYGDGPDKSEIKFWDDISVSGSDNDRRMLRWHSSQKVAIEDVHIHDLKFNANREKYDAYSVCLLLYPNGSLSPNARNILIENVHTTGANQTGIAIRTDNTTIRNCKSYNNGGHGCSTGNAPDNVSVENYEAWECGLNKDGSSSGFYGLDFSDGTNFRAENFEIRDCGNGFKTSAGIIGPVVLSKGSIKNSVDRNIRQTGEGHPDNTLTLNEVTTENGGNDGLRFTDLKKITINNCKCIDEPSPAIYFTSRTRDVEINGLEITGSGSTAILNKASGSVEISGLVVSGYSTEID